MDHLFDSLGHHFTLPRIETVPARRPFVWLKRAWGDLWAAPVASLAYGLIFAIAGSIILYWAADLPYLFTAAISGFLLVGPLLAAGWYELSRRIGKGEAAGLRESVAGWTRNGQSLALAGVFLAMVGLAWERLSAILFALFYQGQAPDLGSLFADVFLSGEYLRFVVAYVAVGGVLAALVFAMCAVSIPMMMDRGSDFVTASMTSLLAVSRNLPAMALWAFLIVALTAIGFATKLVGLIVLLPLLGHATWHAYRDLVR